MKVLLVHQGLRSYVKTDLDILRSAHDVRECYFPGVRREGLLASRALPDLVRGVLWCDVAFAWFGKFHAFSTVVLARLLGKKAVVVVSGGEVCRFSLGPGNPYNSVCTHPVKKWFPRFVARFADLLLPVSDYAHSEAIQSVWATPTRMRRIYHGFDSGLFKRRSGMPKQRIVVTVGDINRENYVLRRLGELASASRMLPHVQFLFIGPDPDGVGELLLGQASENTQLTGPLAGSELVDVLSRAAVYAQASVTESFGCAVAEAMLCECVPVVTSRTALPEVVGDHGVYLDEPVTAEEIAAKIQVALRHPELGLRARQRVIESFSLERRRGELLEAVASLEGDTH